VKTKNSILKSRLTLMICVLVIFGMQPTTESQSDSKRIEYERELKRIGQDIQRALIKRDIVTLAKYKIDDGKSQAKKELQDSASELYCYLFDSSCLRKIASKGGGQKNPFYKTAIIDFFKGNKDFITDVVFWPIAAGKQKSDRQVIASVVFMRPSFKDRFNKILIEGWPLDLWAVEYVACDFIRIENRWVYYGGIFEVAVEEGNIG